MNKLDDVTPVEMTHAEYILWLGECPIPPPSCEECEQHYWEEIHMDMCDESCTQRCEEDDKATGVYDSGKCAGCKCEHCKGEVKYLRP